MKYLALDYGTKRVGVAVSDGEGKIAFPRASLGAGSGLIGQICKLVEEESIGKILVGDTLSHGGARNPVSDPADVFVEQLKGRCPVPVERAHEAWSSIEASRYAPENKQHEDSAAAAVILQRYLDMKGGAIQ